MVLLRSAHDFLTEVDAMNLMIETRTLYAVSYVEGATKLKDYAYELIIAWGPDPMHKDAKTMKDVIFPWVVNELGILEPAEDAIAILDFLPAGAQTWTCSELPQGVAFFNLLAASMEVGGDV